VKTRWISTFFHAKRVLAKYKSLVVKMNVDLGMIEAAS
jgi:hypothetical protein